MMMMFDGDPNLSPGPFYILSALSSQMVEAECVIRYF